MSVSENDYFSDILFHFWGRNMTPEHQFEIFTEISEKGLLLTCGNNSDIDQFVYIRPATGKPSTTILKQWPRVCFTEASEKIRAVVTDKFGKFGIGFTRKTILQWGGGPVWYLPNYSEKDTQYGRFSASMETLSQLMALLQSMTQADATLGRGNAPLSNKESRETLNHFIGTIFFLVSHFKQMSSPDSDDLSFLDEKEWRIVFGLHFGSGPELFRPLTAQEQQHLVAKMPAWGQPYFSGNSAFDETYLSDPMVRDFRLFNGLDGSNTVAKQMRIILTPTHQLEERVRNYVSENKQLFGKNLPQVQTVA